MENEEIEPFEPTNVHFSPESTIEDIRLEIETWKVDNNDRIRCGHSAVIRNDTIAHQIATCLEIVDEHTGELHHYAIEIHNISKYKNKGWEYKEKYRISELHIFNGLFNFFKLIKENQLNQETQEQVLISVDEYEILKGVKGVSTNVIQEVLGNGELLNDLFEAGGGSLFKSIIEMSLKKIDSIELINHLKELDIEALKELNSLAGISQIKSILEVWEQNMENDKEEFWQEALSTNSWVLSQLFSCPVLLFAGKAYVGGKWIDNRGGNLVDFIYQNNLSENTILIEIKTPDTKLMGLNYRRLPAPSEDLSGGILQVLNYKEQLQREHPNIMVGNRDKPSFDVFNPKCLLIIGNLSKEFEGNHDNKKGFELFRANSKDVEIITFDEIFQKISMLLSLLEGK